MQFDDGYDNRWDAKMNNVKMILAVKKGTPSPVWKETFSHIYMLVDDGYGVYEIITSKYIKSSLLTTAKAFGLTGGSGDGQLNIFNT